MSGSHIQAPARLVHLYLPVFEEEEFKVKTFARALEEGRSCCVKRDLKALRLRWRVNLSRI